MLVFEKNINCCTSFVWLVGHTLRHLNHCLDRQRENLLFMTWRWICVMCDDSPSVCPSFFIFGSFPFHHTDCIVICVASWAMASQSTSFARYACIPPAVESARTFDYVCNKILTMHDYSRINIEHWPPEPSCVCLFYRRKISLRSSLKAVWIFMFLFVSLFVGCVVMAIFHECRANFFCTRNFAILMLIKKKHTDYEIDNSTNIAAVARILSAEDAFYWQSKKYFCMVGDTSAIWIYYSNIFLVKWMLWIGFPKLNKKVKSISHQIIVCYTFCYVPKLPIFN